MSSYRAHVREEMLAGQITSTLASAEVLKRGNTYCHMAFLHLCLYSYLFSSSICSFLEYLLGQVLSWGWVYNDYMSQIPWAHEK